MPEPILPFELLRNPIVSGSVACMGLVGMAMFGTVSYVPLFVQGVIGTTATSSGVVLTPLMLGAVVASFVTGQLISRTGRYRWNVCSARPCSPSAWRSSGRWTCIRPAHEAARNMVDLRDRHRLDDAGLRDLGPERRRAGPIGSATALAHFSRQIGATIGVT